MSDSAATATGMSVDEEVEYWIARGRDSPGLPVPTAPEGTVPLLEQEGHGTTEVPEDGRPEFAMVYGDPVSGKTRLRRTKFDRGYVIVDAGDIFQHITPDPAADFPGALEAQVDAIGSRLARRAMQARLPIATEVFGRDPDAMQRLIVLMKEIGYLTNVAFVRADEEDSLRWNAERSVSNVSSYYTDAFNVRWLLDAAEGIREEHQAKRSGVA